MRGKRREESGDGEGRGEVSDAGERQVKGGQGNKEGKRKVGRNWVRWKWWGGCANSTGSRQVYNSVSKLKRWCQ